MKTWVADGLEIWRVWEPFLSISFFREPHFIYCPFFPFFQSPSPCVVSAVLPAHHSLLQGPQDQTAAELLRGESSRSSFAATRIYCRCCPCRSPCCYRRCCCFGLGWLGAGLGAASHSAVFCLLFILEESSLLTSWGIYHSFYVSLGISRAYFCLFGYSYCLLYMWVSLMHFLVSLWSFYLKSCNSLGIYLNFCIYGHSIFHLWEHICILYNSLGIHLTSCIAEVHPTLLRHGRNLLFLVLPAASCMCQLGRRPPPHPPPSLEAWLVHTLADAWRCHTKNTCL